MVCDPETDLSCCPPYGDCGYNHTFDFTGFAGDVRLLGGFPPDPHTVGTSGATLEHRDPWKHTTVLSGDLQGNSSYSVGVDENGVLELTYTDYCHPFSAWCNSHRIITIDSNSMALTIDGLTITKAIFDAVTDWGSHHTQHKTIVQNCIIEGNKNSSMTFSGDAEIRSTVVRHNGNSGTSSHGGIQALFGMNYLIVDSEIYENRSGSIGGGINFGGGTVNEEEWGQMTLVNVKIQGNVARTRGGGFYSSSGHTYMYNCLVSGNRVTGGSPGHGGGIGLTIITGVETTTLHLINSTIVDNHAGNEDGGGGIHIGSSCFASISNSIVWGNVSGSEDDPDGIKLQNHLSSFLTTHSNIQECSDFPSYCDVTSFNNIDADPMFAGSSAAEPYGLDAASPCIDTAENCLIPCNQLEYALVDDPTEVPGWAPVGFECGSDPEETCERLPIDMAGRARVMLGVLDEAVDMGAFEYHPCPVCPEDLNGDGTVGVPDLVALLSAWGRAFRSGADLDGNGVVGVPDLVLLLGAWGSCPSCEESLTGGGSTQDLESCVEAFIADQDVEALMECISAAGGGDVS